jgi:hypothetical protein
MNILLIQLDGKLPNLALMRVSSHHRAKGDKVQLRIGAAFEKRFDDKFDKVDASAIFEKSRPLIERLMRVYPMAIVGGTGHDLSVTVEQFGIETKELTTSLSTISQSIGLRRGDVVKCLLCRAA